MFPNNICFSKIFRITIKPEKQTLFLICIIKCLKYCFQVCLNKIKQNTVILNYTVLSNKR